MSSFTCRTGSLAWVMVILPQDSVRKCQNLVKGKVFLIPRGAANNLCPHWSTGDESRALLLLEEGPSRAREGHSARA